MAKFLMGQHNSGSDKKVESSVRDFYDTYGWVDGDDGSGEDNSFRLFRPSYRAYHKDVERRTLEALAPFEGELLIAGGGDMPDSHVTIAEKFDRVACVDISQQARDIAARRLGKDAEIVDGSILDLPLQNDRFDSVFCSHVIYHIDRDLQQTAINELIRVTKPGGRVVVLYSNPRSPIRYAAGAVHKTSSTFRKMFKARQPSARGNRPDLYFYPHLLSWWDRFISQASVKIQPWDIIGSYEERTIIPSNWIAKGFYGAAGWLEKKNPDLAVRLWQYNIITLNKHT
jgi:ubiquinone/menaquinone biosynthesis C-methylase UbiE